MSELALPKDDYERVFRVIHSVSEAMGANVPHSCMMFGIVGSYLLNKVYGIPARAVAGAALYCVGHDAKGIPNVSVIGSMRDGRPDSDMDNFHFWIHTTEHAIDFMAPIFSQSLASAGHDIKIPANMFQRPLALQKEDGQLLQAGDFDLWPNPELTDVLIDRFLLSSYGPTLIENCEAWLVRSPGELPTTWTIRTVNGEKIQVQLSELVLEGVWGEGMAKA